MLVEIQCDKFMTHNKQRKPIRFHPVKAGFNLTHLAG